MTQKQSNNAAKFYQEQKEFLTEFIMKSGLPEPPNAYTEQDPRRWSGENWKWWLSFQKCNI